LDGFGFLVVQVDEILAENPQNAIEAAVDLLDALVSSCFLNEAGDAGVDHGCGPARLGDQKVANMFCHKFLGEAGAKPGRAAAFLTSISVKSEAAPCQPSQQLSKGKRPMLQTRGWTR